MSASDHGRIRLPDGRILGYADYGDPHGVPIVRCHGAPSSRLEGALLAAASKDLGVRLVVPDRPGMGQSDFQQDRRIEHWPTDVEHLAAALGLQRFALLGVSGGGPYALACAVRIPERVTAIGLVSAVAPFDAPDTFAALKGPSRALYQLARRAPWLLRGLLALMRRAAKSKRTASERMAASFPEPDRRALQRSEVRTHLGAVFDEAMRQGARGVCRDMELIASPWGFDLASVRTPVLLWQGEQDGNVPAAHARYLLGALPNCRATFYPDEAHLSLLVNRHREILSALVGRTKESG
jgi:pimeloyl-ACP methyl ester carboxylesterase